MISTYTKERVSNEYLLHRLGYDFNKQLLSAQV